jgi:Domain of unknown function (DUF1840)
MVYVFTSSACPSVTYLGSVGDEILRRAGKTPGVRGVITVAEIAEVTRRLEDELAREALTKPAGPAEPDGDDPDAPEQPVPLAQRLPPFLELLRCAAAAGKDVTWGL